MKAIKTSRFSSGYKNIRPRVDCRWPDGTPKLRRSAVDLPQGFPEGRADKSGKTRHYPQRRSSESDLRNAQLRPRIRIQAPSSNASSASESDECDSGSEQLFETAEGSVEEVVDTGDSPEDISSSSATSIETVSGHFRTLFSQLEDYMKAADDEKERSMIRQRMNKMKDTMSTINEMFEDLLSDGDSLEKHLMDQQNNNNA